jgi:hypothetical protein
VLIIVISVASSGTLAIFGRYAYANGLDTFTLLFLRFTFSAILMAGLFSLRREPLPRGGIDPGRGAPAHAQPTAPGPGGRPSGKFITGRNKSPEPIFYF